MYAEQDVLKQGEKFSEEGRRQVEVARKQFNDRDYPAALKSYKKIAKKYEESSIGEEAWFKVGECHFAMQQYPEAQDAYDKLFKDYPSTRYVADSSRRLFTIAKLWMEVSDPETHGNIKTVSDSKVVEDVETAAKPSAGVSARHALVPNLMDKRRPVFDTGGRARKALKAIWLNDPTGPLADDALMLTASHYFRQGNYLEADRYFEILRQEYPDSPHVEQAYVLGGHVKQMAYQGPYYDGTTLVSAEDLKERTLMMFPDTKDRQQLRNDLQRIYLLKAQDAWSEVEFWKRKNNPRSVAIYARQVIEEYPETRYAQMAREELGRIDPALIRDLPGMLEFMQSLPQVMPSASEGSGAGARPQSERPEPPVKSVGWSRIFPFGS